MSLFISRLLAEFTRRPPRGDLGEECLMAEEAILKFRGTGEGSPEMVADLAETEIAAADVEALATALQAFIESCPRHPHVSSAMWALSKLNDGALIPFFLAQIHRHTATRHRPAVEQASCALTRLEHDTVRYEHPPGQFDEAGYWQAVEEFLRRHPVA